MAEGNLMVEKCANYLLFLLLPLYHGVDKFY